MLDFHEYEGKRICAAVSGGADSMALLHILKNEAEKCGFSLCAVNCEHGIRGKDSLSDTDLVKRICEEWKIPLYLFSEDCPKRAEEEKISLETAARDFRYRCFRELLERGKADYVATAHHLNDQAETVLFRLCRGTSLSGMGGIKEKSEHFLRPLLDKTKRDLLEYVRKNDISFHDDLTNFERDASRNVIRLDILPKLEEIVPGTSANIARFAGIAAEDDDYLYDLASSLWRFVPPEDINDSGYRLSFSNAKPLFRRACLMVLKSLGIECDYTETHLNAVFSLQSLQTGSKITLPKGIIALRGYEEIIFRFSEGRIRESNAFILDEKVREGKFDGGRYLITVKSLPFTEEETSGAAGKILRFDMDKLPENARFRFRRRGDMFEKFGGGKKSLNKYLIDRKIPSVVRDALPLIADDEGEVYAVCGVEISRKIGVWQTDKKGEKDKYGHTMYLMIAHKKE